MDIKEFVEFGFLQEANRLFFHPLGLALEVKIDDDGSYQLSGIWDYRNDPEGIAFGEVDEVRRQERINKKNRVEQVALEKGISRKQLLGYVIQKLDVENSMLLLSHGQGIREFFDYCFREKSHIIHSLLWS